MAQELIAKLESASEGSRKLDWSIWEALQGVTLNETGEFTGSLRYPEWVISDWRGTTSIDAALALAERKLPVFTVTVVKYQTKSGEPHSAASLLYPYGEVREYCSNSTTPALALCAAILRAEEGESRE